MFFILYVFESYVLTWIQLGYLILLWFLTKEMVVLVVAPKGPPHCNLRKHQQRERCRKSTQNPMGVE